MRHAGDGIGLRLPRKQRPGEEIFSMGSGPLEPRRYSIAINESHCFRLNASTFGKWTPQDDFRRLSYEQPIKYLSSAMPPETGAAQIMIRTGRTTTDIEPNFDNGAWGGP